MAQSIDKLEVQVEATAHGASQVVTSLVTQLTSLQKALNSIDTSKLTKASNASKSVSVDTTSMTNAEKTISKSVNGIKQAIAGLNSYKNAALSGDSSSLTSFNRRVISIQSSIDVLREKLNQLGNTSVPTAAFSSLDSQIEETRTKLEELKAKEESMHGKAIDLGDMVKVQDDIKNTETELDGLVAKQEELIYSGQAYTDPFAEYRNGLDEVQQALTDTASEVSSLTSKMTEVGSSSSLTGIANALSLVADKASEATGSLLKMTASGIKSGFSSLKSKLSGIKDSLTNIGSGASSGVTSAFSKILKYGFGIRSLYVLFRRLKTAVKDSFTELQNSGAYYQTTRANIEALKNSLTTLKYQFGAAFEPIFNTVAPALQTLINYLVAVMNTISAFIAKLTGKSTYSKAVVATAEIASNTGSAAGSAAELNKQLQGFDELNNLDLDSGSSGGSGGGSSSDGSSVSYVEESVDSALTSFWDSLSDAITNGEWYKAGTLISDALTDALTNIDWDPVYEGASNFGTGLAQFLNGLITDDLFSALGSTIAKAIKTALIAAISFSDEFDWIGLGTAIASGINAFVEENPLALLVTAFNTWANGILDTLIAAIQNIKWDEIAQQIADAIGNLDVSGITWRLGTLANSLANALYTLVSNKDTWTNLGTKIGEGITSFFKSMNQVDAKTGLTGWQALGESISSVFSGIKEAITKALENVEWSEVGKGIADFLGSIPLGDIAVVISGISATMALSNLAKTALKTYLTTEATTLIGSLGSVSGGTVAVSVVLAAVIGWKIGGKLYESATGYSGASQGFVATVEDLWDGLFSDAKIEFSLTDFINFTIDDVNSGTGWLKSTGLWKSLTTMRDSIKSAWNSLTSGSGETLGTSGYNGAPSEAVTYIENQKANSYWNDIGKNIINGIESGLELALLSNPFTAPVYKLFTVLVDEIKKVFGIASPAKAMYDYGKNIFLGIIEGFIQEMNNYGWDDLAEDLKNLFTGTTTTKTGNTAQGNFNRNSDKVHGGKNGNTVTYKINTETQINGSKKSKTEINEYATAYDDLFKNASQSASATYSAETGGQLKTIDDVTDWKTKFHNLYQQWMGRDAQFTSSEDGIANGKISGWIVKLGELAKEWLGKSTSATFSTKESGLSSFYTEKTGYLAKLDNLNTAWEGKGKTRTATFTTNLAGNLNSSNALSTAATAMSTLNSSFEGDKSASFSVSYSGPSGESLASTAGGVSSINESFANSSSQSLDYSLTASVDMESVNAAVSKITNAVKKGMTTKWKISEVATALGGVIAHGTKYNIPQYAGGTLNAGSVFVAGENGPEVMGHINGRTEILNRSQIASIMNNSFVSAMAQFGNRMLTSPETIAYKTGTYQTYSGSDSNGNNMYVAEQNELLRQQNELLMQILEKPTGISSRDIFNATRSEANNYYNRTGNSPFI